VATTNGIVSNNVNVTAAPALLLGWMCDEFGNGGWTAGSSPNAFTRRVNGNYNMLQDFRITSTGNALANATNTHGATDDFVSYVIAISESGGGSARTNQNGTLMGVSKLIKQKPAANDSDFPHRKAA
jgi:hypothetical protein